jgi:hypothetical protein
MSRALLHLRSAVGALVDAPAAVVDSLTARLPRFRWERWAGTTRWLLTSAPEVGRQPVVSDLRLWGLGRLTLMRVSC